MIDEIIKYKYRDDTYNAIKSFQKKYNTKHKNDEWFKELKEDWTAGPETLAKFGYKPLVEVECPNEEGYTYTVEYVDSEDQVIKNWVAHEIEIEEEPIEE